MQNALENIVLGYGARVLLILIIALWILGSVVPIGSGVKKSLIRHGLGGGKYSWTEEEIAKLNPFWYGLYRKVVIAAVLVGLLTALGFLAMFVISQ